MMNAKQPSRLVIASRESRLALWQANHIASRLKTLYPDCLVEILGMTTRGDRLLDQSLSRVGGKGLFVKELETALQEGQADLAVHSLKDVPMEVPDGFSIAAIPARENPRDAFVSERYACLDDLPAGARIGTSSLRREAALRTRYPALQVESLRGNLDTRLKKLDEGRYDAIILAAAGLLRLGLSERIRSFITPENMLPAPGQGALAVEILANRHDLAAWIAPLNDENTACCVRAERAFSKTLFGSCQVPLGAYATIENNRLRLEGFIATPDGKTTLRGEKESAPKDAQKMGIALAQDLLERGASAILADLKLAADADTRPPLAQPTGHREGTPS